MTNIRIESPGGDLSVGRFEQAFLQAAALVEK
jgi:hypothetical protein